MHTKPTLGTPDYTKPFLLYEANRCDGYVAAVLCQETCQGRKKEPLNYYSTKLDGVTHGWPRCYQGLAAVYYAYNKALTLKTLTVGHPVIIHIHHKITRMLKQAEHKVITEKYLALLGKLDNSVCGLGNSATKSSATSLTTNHHFCLSAFSTGNIGVLHGLLV